jgi:hypothetical protein
VEGASDPEAQEGLVGVLGMVDADWGWKEGFVNGLWGLQDEDLEEDVKRVVAAS